MLKVILLVGALTLGSVAPASAEVVSAGANGFQVRQQVVVPASPAAAYAQFVKIGAWWSKDHTYSGDARNLKITPRADGCWCERMQDSGSVKHMEVVFAQPGDKLVFAGGLGPLQSMGASGAMTVTFEKDDAGAKVTLTYIVSGYAGLGFDKIAAPVDGVLNEQIKRYASLWARP
jgi:hypothetical protein